MPTVKGRADAYPASALNFNKDQSRLFGPLTDPAYWAGLDAARVPAGTGVNLSTSNILSAKDQSRLFGPFTDPAYWAGVEAARIAKGISTKDLLASAPKTASVLASAPKTAAAAAAAPAEARPAGPNYSYVAVPGQPGVFAPSGTIGGYASIQAGNHNVATYVGGGGSSGGRGSKSVLCLHYAQIGWLDFATYHEMRARWQYPFVVQVGYLTWATSLVAWMRRRSTAARVVEAAIWPLVRLYAGGWLRPVFIAGAWLLGHAILAVNPGANPLFATAAVMPEFFEDYPPHSGVAKTTADMVR